MKSYKPHFPALVVWKENGILNCKDLQRLSISIGKPGLSPVFSNRANSTASIIKEADDKYGFRDFEPVVINLSDSDDHYKWGVDNSVRLLNYCTRWDNFGDTCPDFTFDSWGQAGYSEYDEFCRKILDAGMSKPEVDIAVWRGAVKENNRVRKKLVALSENKFLDLKDVSPITGNPEDCIFADGYMPIDEQVSKFRYIIDANGHGHSRRLKLELFSGRVIFVVERRYLEWFNETLEPWIHYVPVKQDCSDLIEKIEIVRSSPELEEKICNNSRDFALKNLRKENALDRFNILLNIQDSRPNDFSLIFQKGRYTDMDCRDDDYRESL